MRIRTLRTLLAVLALAGLFGAGLITALNITPSLLLYLAAGVVLACVLSLVAALLARRRPPLAEPPRPADLTGWIDEAERAGSRDAVHELLCRLGRWPHLLNLLTRADRARVAELVERTGAAAVLHEWSVRRRPPQRQLGAIHLLGWLRVDGAAERLQQLTGSEDRDVAQAASSAIMRIGTQHGYRVLLEGLGEGTLPPSRVAAMLEHGEPELLAPLAESLADDPAPGRRFWAAYLLGQLPLDANIDPLLRLAADASPDVRANAAEALGDRGRGSDVVRSRLDELLGDSSWVVQAHAAKALRRIGAQPSRQALERLLDNPSWWVRYHALRALSDNGAGGAGTGRGSETGRA